MIYDSGDQWGIGFILLLTTTLIASKHTGGKVTTRAPKITETRWPNGWKMYVASNGVVNYMLRKFIKPSDLPYFEAGVTTHLLFDDRSKD